MSSSRTGLLPKNTEILPFTLQYMYRIPFGVNALLQITLTIKVKQEKDIADHYWPRIVCFLVCLRSYCIIRQL